ncbi:MAG: cob(I)yrinic acid a,c-diamide adenosyltransferase [Thermodesulfovibrio sp.]|uniref:cob(I)yrinic acid a,c-diamide adenosyltransferase n=1 Tax=Thermodesulfovibrio sp. TaxID=2067987 RepID=UPI003D144A8C
MIHVYTGDGKGKTTAAVGATIRAIGNGLKVFFVQFIKGAHTGELEIFKNFPELIEVYRCSTGFVYGKPEPSQINVVMKCIQEIEILIKKQHYDLIVFDELTVGLNTGLVSKEQAQKLIDLARDAELIITGREAPEWLIERADLVTEMKKIKHYFDIGIKARRGIEY